VQFLQLENRNTLRLKETDVTVKFSQAIRCVNVELLPDTSETVSVLTIKGLCDA
jgi:hypothetical protein